MKDAPSKFIHLALLFLIVYLPLEDFVLKWVPVPESLYVLLRQGSELIIYLLLAITILGRVLLRQNFRIVKGAFNLFFLLFIAYTLVLIFFSEASFVSGLKNVKGLLRYVLLIFILANINLSESYIKRVYQCILLSVFVQALIGVFQLLGGAPVKTFFAARALSGEESLLRSFSSLNKLDTDIFGTITTTIGYGFFLLVGFILLLVFKDYLIKSKSIRYLTYALIIACTYYSGSRIALFALAIPIFHQLYLWDKKKSVVSVTVAMSFLILYGVFFADKGENNQSFWFIFNDKFISTLEMQRFGLILFVFIPFLFDSHLIFGLGPDKDYFVSYVTKNFDIPFFFPDAYLYSIKDIYWFSLIIFFGVIGTLIFLLFFSSILKKSLTIYLKMTGNNKNIGLIVLYLGVILIPLNLFNQAFEIRQVSFYFWLVVALLFNYPKERKLTTKYES